MRSKELELSNEILSALSARMADHMAEKNVITY